MGSGPSEIADLNRDVYCMLGLIFDAVTVDEATTKLRQAIAVREPYLLSTPNVNFVVNAQGNEEFRETVLYSDLSVADGMPIIWLARLLGIPLPERVAGSDLFNRLKDRRDKASHPLSVFFFGGAAGVSEKARDNLNDQNGILTCAGALDPGYASVDELSCNGNIAAVNDSGADFLVTALGAVKGHIWLEQNKDNLHIPIRSHLGAVVNFEAGSVVRSPDFMSKMGLEWLWRIKEEPQLWRRYWSDGCGLIGLMFTRVLPLVIWNWRANRAAGVLANKFSITCELSDDRSMISMSGHIDKDNLGEIRKCFQYVANHRQDVFVDLSHLTHINSSTLGSFVMLKKQMMQQNLFLKITDASSQIQKVFKWHGLEFMTE